MDRILKDLFGFDDEPAAAPAAAPSPPPAPEATATEAAKSVDPDREARRAARREARQQRRADPERRRKRDEFVERYTTGDPSEGFTTQEAIEHLRDMQGELTPAGFRKAMQHTLENLPPSQREEFIALMQQHKARQPAAAAGATARAVSADPFGGLLTGLMGGSAAGAGGAGLGDLLDDLAKGGLHAPSRGSGEKPTEQDFQDLLNSPLGRAVLGGIAANGMRQMQQDDDDYDTPGGRRARA